MVVSSPLLTITKVLTEVVVGFQVDVLLDKVVKTCIDCDCRCVDLQCSFRI
jgi:hypothetical protein